MSVFYLKINKHNMEGWRYLRQWIDIANFSPASVVYIICDNSILKDYLLDNMDFMSVNYKFIESNLDSNELKSVVNAGNIAKKYKGAAYAHLTAFSHAREMGYENFWAINADEIGIYDAPVFNAELLKAVEEQLRSQNVDLMSLNMVSENPENEKNFWNLGITYVNNKVDWLGILKKYALDGSFKNEERLDNYFGYLSNSKIKDADIKTFWIENLYFIHHHENVYRNPHHGLNYFSNGKIYSSTLTHSFGLGEKGASLLPENSIKINFDIKPDAGVERLKLVAYWCNSWTRVFINTPSDDYEPWKRFSTDPSYANDEARLADFSEWVIKWKSFT